MELFDDWEQQYIEADPFSVHDGIIRVDYWDGAVRYSVLVSFTQDEITIKTS